MVPPSAIKRTRPRMRGDRFLAPPNNLSQRRFQGRVAGPGQVVEVLKLLPPVVTGGKVPNIVTKPLKNGRNKSIPARHEGVDCGPLHRQRPVSRTCQPFPKRPGHTGAGWHASDCLPTTHSRFFVRFFLMGRSSSDPVVVRNSPGEVDVVSGSMVSNAQWDCG
jgi:hypothetical protein